MAIFCSHIFLQLCTGGDLFTYINNYSGRNISHIDQPEAKYIMYQLLKGLAYLHDKSISHRGTNPLLSVSFSFKL